MLDARLNKAKLQKLKARFLEVDVQGTGSISPDLFRGILKSEMLTKDYDLETETVKAMSEQEQVTYEKFSRLVDLYSYLPVVEVKEGRNLSTEIFHILCAGPTSSYLPSATTQSKPVSIAM